MRDRNTARRTDTTFAAVNRRLAVASIAAALCLLTAGCLRVNVQGDPAAAAEQLSQRTLEAIARSTPMRIATYNVSLYDESAGGLIRRLEAGDDGAKSDTL